MGPPLKFVRGRLSGCHPNSSLLPPADKVSLGAISSHLRGKPDYHVERPGGQVLCKRSLIPTLRRTAAMA
jgi:hypothetical protein